MGVCTCSDVQHACSWLEVWLQQLQAYGMHVRRADGLTLTDGQWVVLQERCMEGQHKRIQHGAGTHAAGEQRDI